MKIVHSPLENVPPQNIVPYFTLLIYTFLTVLIQYSLFALKNVNV